MLNWLRRIKGEIIRFKQFRAYSDVEVQLKCQAIWEEMLEAERTSAYKKGYKSYIKTASEL